MLQVNAASLGQSSLQMNRWGQLAHGALPRPGGLSCRWPSSLSWALVCICILGPIEGVAREHHQTSLVTSGPASQRLCLQAHTFSLVSRATSPAIKMYLYIPTWSSLSRLGKLAIDPHI